MTLTFDLVTWELIGVTSQSWSMYLWSLMILGVSILELSSGNHFTVLSHRDLWPSDLNINRGHLPVMINVPMKFHDPRRKFSWVIIRKQFYSWVTVTLTLVTWKSIGVICQSWSMYLWSFMILGVSILELSSGNHLVDGRTDRPTDMCKTIYPLFFEGGHNKTHLRSLFLFCNVFFCLDFMIWQKYNRSVFQYWIYYTCWIKCSPGNLPLEIFGGIADLENVHIITFIMCINCWFVRTSRY